VPWAEASTLSAGEIAAWDAQVPALAGSNILEDFAEPAVWLLGSGTDVSDNAFSPPWWASIRQPATVSYPESLNGQTQVYYTCTLNAGADAAHWFDFAEIINHNLGTIGSCNVDIEIASNLAFTSNAFTLATITDITSNERIGAFNLVNDGTEYARLYSVPYLRFRIYKTAGTFGVVRPFVGAFWAGRRRQLAYKPRTPWDAYASESDVVDFIADGGQRTRYVKSQGRGIFELSTHGGTSADLVYSINQMTQLRNWWIECDHGSKPSLFFAQPAAKGGLAYVVYPDPSLSMPLIGPFERETTIRLIESAPYFSQE